MKYEEKTLTRDSKFKGNIFEVAVDEVLLPDGKTSRRELIFHRGAVAVLAVTPEGKLVIVKQYRKAIEDVSYARLVMKRMQQHVNLKKKPNIRVI